MMFEGYEFLHDRIQELRNDVQDIKKQRGRDREEAEQNREEAEQNLQAKTNLFEYLFDAFGELQKKLPSDHSSHLPGA